MYGYIYKTTNLITNKIYIGQKKSDHFLNEKYLGSGKLIKQSIEKHGKENFKIELIEECSSQEELDEREIYWISYFNSQDRNVGYNITAGGELRYNVWEMLSDEEQKLLHEKLNRAKIGRLKSDETKSKISNTKLEYYKSEEGFKLKQKLSDMYIGHIPWNKDKKLDEEYCQRMRESHPKGYFNHTEETKAQISKTMKEKFASGELVQHEGAGKKRCMNIDTGEIFDSLTSAAKKYNISNATGIARCAEGRYKTCGGQHWKLLDNDE